MLEHPQDRLSCTGVAEDCGAPRIDADFRGSFIATNEGDLYLQIGARAPGVFAARYGLQQIEPDSRVVKHADYCAPDVIVGDEKCAGGGTAIAVGRLGAGVALALR